MPSIHIDSLPPEILREIFLESIQTNRPEYSWINRSNLCLVCTHWRQIATSHARLWSTIYIALQPHSRFLWPPVSAVDFCLKQSKDTPLEIHLRYAHVYHPDEKTLIDQYTADVFPLLAMHSFRWQHLVIDLDNTLVCHIRSIAFANAERLEHVDVMVEGEMYDETSYEMTCSERDVAVISALADAPNLRFLEWRSDSDVIMYYILTTFPLERLTRFKLHCPMFLSELLQVMQKCTSVVEMEIGTGYPINMEEFDDSGVPASPLVVLPNLRTLELSIEHAEYHILKYFEFPNLEVINIDTSPFQTLPGDNDITPILHFLSKSRHRVQILVIHDNALQLEGLADFLSNSAVSRIPIVQVRTRSLPIDIRFDIFEAVETRAPDILQKEIIITPEDDGRWDFTVMAWTDTSTYQKFKGYLSKSSWRSPQMLRQYSDS